MSSQLWQQPAVRNYFGQWSPPAIAGLAVLNNPGCFRVAWYSAPQYDERLIPESGYRQSQLALPVGGYIVGLAQATTAPTASNVYQVLLTDLSLNRQLFNAPIEAAALRGAPYLFPDAYPIVGEGVFRVELWNPVVGSGDILAEVVLLVVEPK